jgi:hypothetical protein
MTDSPYSVESLSRTWHKMRHHSRSLAIRELAVGADGTRAEAFEAGLSQNLKEISRRIHRTDHDGLPSYHFGPLLVFEHSRVGGVSRNIYVARLRDQLVLRVMHDLVCAAAQEQWATSLKPPKPIEMIDSFKRDAAAFSCPFILRTDIQSFFESVPRERVAEQAANLISEPITQRLLRRWSKHIIARPAWHSGRGCDFQVGGLPPGLSLSSSLAELYLVNLDSQAHKWLHWFRYVDDILVLCKSEAEAKAAQEWIRGAIENLSLSISMPKTKIARLQDGVSWLGLVHFNSETRADPSRVKRWLRRLVSMKRHAVEQVRACSDPESRAAAVAEFHHNLRREVRGVGNSRPHWYSRVSDDGLWRQLDSSLHAMIRSLHRLASLPAPSGRFLPSVHSNIAVRRQRLSAPQNAEQGQCVNSPDDSGLTADQGQIAARGAETI